MSHTTPPGSVLLQNNVQFFPPGPQGDDWHFVSAVFLPGFNSPPDEFCEYVDTGFYTTNFLDVDVNAIAAQIQDQFFLQGEGTPLAIRVWHREIIDFGVPNQVCVPSSFLGIGIPFVGGACQSVPFIGGTDIASAHEWVVQVIYHNIIPAAVVIGLVILAIFGIVIGLKVISHGDIDLLPPVRQTIKDFSPAGEADAIVRVIAVGAGALLLAAILFPQLGSQVGNALRSGTQLSGNVKTAAPLRLTNRRR